MLTVMTRFHRYIRGTFTNSDRLGVNLEAAVWQCVLLIVRTRQEGLASHLLQSFQNQVQEQKMGYLSCISKGMERLVKS